MAAGALLLAIAGLDGLHFNSHYGAYFDGDDPLIRQHAELFATYARNDYALVVLESKQATFLDREAYELLESLTDSLAELPYATATTSLTMLGLVGEQEFDDGLLIPSFEQLQRHDRAFGLLISDDARFAAIRTTFDLPDSAATTVQDTMRRLRTLAESALEGTSVQFHVSGTLALSEAYISVVRHDLFVIVPLLLLVMCVVLASSLGGPRVLLAVVPIGLIAVLASFGLTGLLSTELTAINAFVPVIILSISLAGCVHITYDYQGQRHSGTLPQAAAMAAVQENLFPMTLANGTTALGFFALALSPSPPVRSLGYIVAAGVLASYLLCITLLPVLLARLDPRSTRGTHIARRVTSMASAARRNRGFVVLFFGLTMLLSLWSASKSEISDNVFDYFPESHAFHTATRIVDERFSGVNEVLYSVDAKEANSMLQVSTIDALDTFTSWLRSQPEVQRVTTIADHQSIQEARIDGRLEERLERYRQTFEHDGSTRPVLARELSADLSSTLVSVYLQPMNSSELVSFDERRLDWTSNNIAHLKVLAGGAPLMFAHLGENNVRSMIYALSAGLFVAAVIFGLVFRSLRIAIISLACNFFPIIFVYGAWAMLGGSISIGAAVVMGMVLGIVIDDSAYILAMHRRSADEETRDPIASAMQHVGPALVITTITLLAGLGTGVFSEFGPILSMAVLSVATIGVALLSDLTLLPAMLSSQRRAVKS